MPAARRILLAGLFHETHSFVSPNTTLADFAVRRGDDLMGRRGDGSTIDGFLEVAELEGWAVQSTIEYSALPAGTIEQSVFDEFCCEFDEGLKQALANGGLDGIWLSLHGAMVTTGSVDPEGDLLARIRRTPGAERLPIFGVFDLHANFTKAMADGANALVAYRENPHSDARESSVRSARLLARALSEGRSPRMFSANAPVVWPPTGTGTADRPMRDLEALARAIENENPDIWSVSVIGGYAFSDVPDAGVAFCLATTGAEKDARAALQRLVDLAVELRDLGLPEEWDLDAAVAKIKNSAGGPHIIVEPADNIGGGAPGDITLVLRAFLKHGLTNSAVAIADAAAVRALDGAWPGEKRRLSIGGKGSPLTDEPLEIEATFVSRSDGAFSLEDINSHLAASQGSRFEMGPSAVVTVGDGITVLLTSRKTPPFDLAQFRSQGVHPEKLTAIGVKAAVAHRRAYDKIAASSYTVATAGPCTSKLETLPYARLRRPIFPLDPTA